MMTNWKEFVEGRTGQPEAPLMTLAWEAAGRIVTGLASADFDVAYARLDMAVDIFTVMSGSAPSEETLAAYLPRGRAR